MDDIVRVTCRVFKNHGYKPDEHELNSYRVHLLLGVVDQIHKISTALTDGLHLMSSQYGHQELGKTSEAKQGKIFFEFYMFSMLQPLGNDISQ